MNHFLSLVKKLCTRTGSPGSGATAEVARALSHAFPDDGVHRTLPTEEGWWTNGRCCVRVLALRPKTETTSAQFQIQWLPNAAPTWVGLIEGKWVQLSLSWLYGLTLSLPEHQHDDGCECPAASSGMRLGDPAEASA